MARQGRDLEKLVALLERALQGSGAIVKSPDSITDKVTGEKREVDVSVRIGPEGQQKLFIFECRDRNKPQDVTWVEQVVTKVKDLEATVGYMVSSTGFSESARQKAKKHKIVLRDLTRLTEDDLRFWFKLKKLGIVENHYQIVKMLLFGPKGNIVRPASAVSVRLFATKGNEKVFVPNNAPAFSPNAILHRAMNDSGIDHWPSVIQRNPVNKHIFRVSLANWKVFIETDDGPAEVDRLELTAIFFTKRIETHVSLIKGYNEGKNRLAETLTLESNDGKTKTVVTMHNLETGSYIKVEKKEPKPKISSIRIPVPKKVVRKSGQKPMGYS